MINLRSLMDLLPYYFKEHDTYKVKGKGLLERYLDIFGEYFDEKVVKDIDTLDNIIDIDNTPEIYLGYLWEFLGSMPYANPGAIDPDKWKQYFNGFQDDSTIESLSKLWLYRKDSDGDNFTLSLDKVRALVKYSVALFSIRGTKKFFEVLLRIYGFEVSITNGSTYPKTTFQDGDDSDYYGTDDDYYGTDDDYAGSIDSLFDNLTEITKLDSEWSNLDQDTLDNHTNCTRLVNVNFRLKSDIVYDVQSNEFLRLQDRLFNLINLFLPLGTRPHLIWDNTSEGDNFVSKVNRYLEVYVDRVPVNWDQSDTVFVKSTEYPGWYRVVDKSPQAPVRPFDWLPLRFMVKVIDSYNNNHNVAFIKDQPKKFKVAFDGIYYSDTEYDDGHIFTINPGQTGLYPAFKVSVLCEDDFNFNPSIVRTFSISSWVKYFNYYLFKWYNENTIDIKLSTTNKFVPILIQSAFVRTYKLDANPEDDEFNPSQIINLTTGELLTLCESGTTIDDYDGNPVDYSQYADRCMYVQHIFKPGIYEFAMVSNPEYRFTINITTVDEILSISLIEGVQNNTIDNDNPSCSIRLRVTSNLGFLYDRFIIKETSNPVTQYWDNDQAIILSDPGHYRFYGVNLDNSLATSNHIDINVLSNKYDVHYYLEVEDGDKSDDEMYMVRTLIPEISVPGSTVNWGFDFTLTLDKSIVEAQEIQVLDPNSFDLEVLLYRGGTPNTGTLLGSYTADVEVLTDSLGNVLPNYKVKGHISLRWNGTYNVIVGQDLSQSNYPPGLYCIELHTKTPWANKPTYRVIDAYTVPKKFDGNLYFDVDIISKAWTSPAGQVYDIDPITGMYTWGWYKTNPDQLHSVRVVRYNPAISTPQFRLKLTNNVIGYTRVYLYKLVDNGSNWDIGAGYPEILPPKVKSNISSEPIDNPHWLNEAVPKNWGFPGEYNADLGRWDFSKGDDGIVGYTGRWLFTGSVYQLGEIITGPQEPGKYIFIVNQLEVDTKIINYAYLEVKENIEYSLIVNPLLAILQGTAVGTTVDVISSAKYTKETLAVTVTNPNGTEVEEYHQLPYAFYAYQPGTYTFKLYKFENGQWVYLGLSSAFKVLTDNGVSDEYLYWEWSDVSDREVQVATTSQDVSWSVKVQNE